MEQVDRQEPDVKVPPPDLNVNGSEGMGRIGKITSEMRGLVGDIKEWAELKLQLLQLQVEERIEGFASKVMALVVMALTALIALLFLLTAAALGLGSWLGHPAWGYLVVGGFLLVVTFILQARRPRMRKDTEEKKEEDKGALLSAADQKQLEFQTQPSQQSLPQLKGESNGQ